MSDKQYHELGRGGFGTVYWKKDEKGRKIAIKEMELTDEGIPSLMELSIMSTINHPFLNKASKIVIEEKYVSIYQEIAINDLYHYTRKYKNKDKKFIGVRPSSYQLKLWTHQLAQVLNYLHQNDIVHGDVKASNILLYDNDTIKLTDFSISQKTWNMPIKKSLCTSSHRPPEMWNLDEKWIDYEDAFKIDMWSLGCTLYELLFGSCLFKIYYNEEDKSNTKYDTIKKRFHNLLIDWDIITNQGYYNDKEKYQCDYISLNLINAFNHPSDEDKPFVTLIKQLLMIDPKLRPSSLEICLDPLFQGFTMPIASILTNSLPKIYTENELLNKLSIEGSVKNLSLQIYGRLEDTVLQKDPFSIHACLWIANKLVYNGRIENKLKKEVNQKNADYRVVQLERKICEYLGFRLHNIYKK